VSGQPVRVVNPDRQPESSGREEANVQWEPVEAGQKTVEASTESSTVLQYIEIINTEGATVKRVVQHLCYS
jgi:hypothetical protein